MVNLHARVLPPQPSVIETSCVRILKNVSDKMQGREHTVRDAQNVSGCVARNECLALGYREQLRFSRDR